jgi:hypothetical protein
MAVYGIRDTDSLEVFTIVEWDGSSSISLASNHELISGSLTASYSGSDAPPNPFDTPITGSLLGSLEGTASYAISASYAIIQKDIKSGAVPQGGWNLTGGQYVYDVSFDTQYTTQDYSVTVTAVSDARIWTVQPKIVSGFRINSNSNTPLTGDVYWMSIPYNS